MHRILLVCAAVALPFGACASDAKAPATWDGLVHVPSKKLTAVYLLPNADFRGYTQVMFDPPQVAFQKDWERNYNDSEVDLDRQVSNSYVTNTVTMAQKSLTKLFPESFTTSGFQLAAAPGPHVLRLAVYVLDLNVAAPDVSVGMTNTYTMDAGSATFAIEARDSMTGQLLGRAVDPKIAGDDVASIRTRGTNEADFEALFKRWATISANGLNTLRSSSPVDTDGVQKK